VSSAAALYTTVNTGDSIELQTLMKDQP